MDENMKTIGVRFERHGRHTVALIVDDDGEEIIFARGETLRSKADVACEEVGNMIALGRAFQAWGRQVEQWGHEHCVTKVEFARVKEIMDWRSEEYARKQADKKATGKA